jgi:hypothetical protein
MSNATFQAAIVASEVQRQADMDTARANFENIYLPAFSHAAFGAAAKTADIAHQRQLLASSIALGLSPTSYICVLKELGTGGS